MSLTAILFPDQGTQFVQRRRETMLALQPRDVEPVHA